MDHAASLLILVRHGETEGNSSIRYYGRTDIGLSDLGRAQMRSVRSELVRMLGEAAWTRLFSSPMSRALESARLIAGEHSTPTVLEEFRELDFGIFEGLTAEEIQSRYPEEYGRWMRDRFSPEFTFPGGDNRAAFARRVEAGLERLLELLGPSQPAHRHALLVAHRGVIRAIVRRLAGVSPVVELGSIQILARDREWRPVDLDLTSHLAEF